MLQMTGRQQFMPDNMPRLLWFKNIADMYSVTKFKPEEISVLLGPQARLVEAFVEITDAPIVIVIDTKLPWYRSLKGRGTIMLPNGLSIFHAMFIGRAS